MKLKCVLISAIVISLLLLHEVSHASRVFFTGGYGHLIREIDTRSGQIENIGNTLGGHLSDLSYDPANQTIYYAFTSGPSGIGRYNLQTQHDEILIAGWDIGGGRVEIHDIAVDVVNSRLYFSDYYNGGIYRSNLDGTGIEMLVKPDYFLSGPKALDIYVPGNKLYWCDNGYMLCANLDGTMEQELFHASCAEIAIDHINQKLYWTFRGTIMMSDLDGTDIETILRTDLWMGTLVVDPHTGKLFWHGKILGERNHFVIQSCNLDGTSWETVFDFGVSVVDAPGGMCLGQNREAFWVQSISSRKVTAVRPLID